MATSKKKLYDLGDTSLFPKDMYGVIEGSGGDAFTLYCEDIKGACDSSSLEDPTIAHYKLVGFGKAKIPSTPKATLVNVHKVK